MPRPKEYVVALTVAQRKELKTLVSTGTHPARMITRARILLALDETAGPAPDRRVVAGRVGVSEGTVLRVAKQYAQAAGRVGQVVARKPRATPPVAAKVTGEVEARIIALACTTPPEGYSRWTLRLLERQILLTDGIPPLDHSTIGEVLKGGAQTPPEEMLDDPTGEERRVRHSDGRRPQRLRLAV